MNNADHWVKALSISTSDCSTKQLLAAIADKSQGTDFYIAAECIVEPYMKDDYGYFDWMDENYSRWASWIRQVFGKEWGDLADRVANEGY